MLHEFVTANRDEIIVRCRNRVAGRPVTPPAGTANDHGVPVFLDQLLDEWCFGPTSNPIITATAMEHGRDFLRQGYSVAQLVHDYGDVCQSLTELAIECDARITAEDFRTLNRCLDDAIAGAVTAYANQQQLSLGIGVNEEGERLVVLARGLRVDLEAIRLAFDTMVSGAVGVTGGTAMLLERSLTQAHERNDRMLAELRAVEQPGAPAR